MATRANNRTAAVNKSLSVRQRLNAVIDQVFDNAYKVIILKVTQTSTNAPVVVELRNDLGGAAITWAHTGTGIFTGTKTGAFLADTVIPAGKVMDADTEDSYTLRRATDDTIVIETGTAGTLANDLLSGEIIEFKVLNPLEG